METLITCLTPPGKAAIATLAVRGPLAWHVTRQLFRPRKGSLPETPSAGYFWLGKLGTETADDVILAVKKDSLELHCHGGVEVVRMLQELYTAHGVVSVPWQRFNPDPIVVLLAHAPTTRTAAILLDQANGAWQSCAKESVLPRLHALIPLGQHLVEPWKVVIAGAPNVGKSSLLNALAGYTRCIVSPIAGTTRDAVGVRLAIDGWPIEMIDTAGIRASAGGLEQQGILRAFAALQSADLRLWLLDGSCEPCFPEEAAGWQLIINKVDLPAAWDWDLARGALRISAQTQVGLADLCEMISRRLEPNPPVSGEAVPCLADQVAWILAQIEMD